MAEVKLKLEDGLCNYLSNHTEQSVEGYIVLVACKDSNAVLRYNMPLTVEIGMVERLRATLRYESLQENLDSTSDELIEAFQVSTRKLMDRIDLLEKYLTGDQLDEVDETLGESDDDDDEYAKEVVGEIVRSTEDVPGEKDANYQPE